MQEKTALWMIRPNPLLASRKEDPPLPLPGGEDTSLPPSNEEDTPLPPSRGDYYALRMYMLPVGETELQKKVDDLRQVLEIEWKRHRGKPIDLRSKKDTRLSFTQASYDLYTLLIPEELRPFISSPPNPLLQEDGRKTLSIIPTGPLYALPFEALVTLAPKSSYPTGERDQRGVSRKGEIVQYLIEDIPISYLSSASLLKTLRESRARRTLTARYPLLAFAHPVYEEPTPSPSQEGIPSPDPSYQGKGTHVHTQEGNVSLQALRSQAYQDFLRGYFKELPETSEEAREITKLLNAPDESEPLQLREQASCANVFAFNTTDRLDDYQYLLFAMHGVLPGEIDHVTQSALVLSDDFLTMADVFGLQLNAKLVSLSACNTGRGTQARGEGVMGLTRAFMYAGTPTVSVTLWSVESFSAKDLNIGFFRHLNDGQSPTHALRVIKLQMLHGEKGEDYRHPYYWAPFVVFGDGM
jgi:CHAT domain-containing protein